LDFPGEWYLAENRRFLDLEFFNRIGQVRSLINTKLKNDAIYLSCHFLKTNNK
jgi:hypothetical protein